MTRQRFIVAVAALAAIAAGGFGTFHHSAATTTFPVVDKYTFVSTPIAPAGSLAAGATTSITLTATDLGNPVANAVIDLSIAPSGLQPGGSNDGGATVSATALTTTPTQFTANSSGVITIVYSTPATLLPTSGRDVITASDPNSTASSKTDAYAFSALHSFTWNPPAPIAASGSLSGGDAVTFHVVAEDSTGTPIPSATVFLSLTSTASTPGSATAVDTNPAVTKTLTSTPKTFIADSSGMVSVTYTAPASLPNGGTDTITAQDKGTNPTVTSSDTYTFSSSTPPPPFGPDNVGAPQVAVTPDGSTQLVFWKDSVSNQLTEAWYTGTWNGPMAFPQLGAISSTPGVAVTKNGSTQLVFWQGPGGHLFEAWFTGVWNGPLDITTTYLGGQGILGSAPSVTTTTDGTQLVFWRGTDGHLTEAWYSNGWHGPTEPAAGSLASAPSSTVSADGSTQLVFFRGTDNLLTEDWFAGGAWHGPMERGATSSSPSVAVTPDGSTQLVFYQGPGGHLFEDWYTGVWNGPVDFTAAAFAGVGLLTSPPSATVTVDGSTQLVFWQGAGNTLWEGWYAGGAWHGPVDWSAA